MKLIPIILTLLAVGCARQPTYQDVQAYGEDRFIRDMLAVREGKPIPDEMKEQFDPIRAEAHLTGAWLVMSESKQYQSGIYVDPESLANWGGSGMDISRWSKQIGWSKEKVRK